MESNHKTISPIEDENDLSEVDKLPEENSGSHLEESEESPETPVEEPEDKQEETTLMPYDPYDINVKSMSRSLDTLINRMEHGEINLDTDFQRLVVWSKQKKSRLIESILLRLPLPSFYFVDETDSNQRGIERKERWDIVDGLQRLSTLREFVLEKENPLELEGLEFLHALHGLTYDKLPSTLQRAIKETNVNIYLIERGTPPMVKFFIFRRINTGGMTLTAQEIRHALNYGIPAEFVKELAGSEEFLQATQNRVPTLRMEDRDFITRFISFYLLGFQKYQPDMDSFLNAGMREIGNIDEKGRKELKQCFIKAMILAIEIFGNDAFRKRYDENHRRKPLNKALFEVLSSSFASIARDQPVEFEKLRRRGRTFRRNFIKLMSSDSDFDRSITQGTGQKDAIEKRHKKIQNIISQTLA